MSERSVTLTLKPPGRIQHLWYRRLGSEPPMSEGSTGPWHAKWVRLLPYRWRTVHCAYARVFGFFWIPCPLCVRGFGGHEIGDNIPDPFNGPNRGMGICSQCTITRNRLSGRIHGQHLEEDE